MRTRSRQPVLLSEDRGARILTGAAIACDALATAALLGALGCIAASVAAVFIDGRSLAAVAWMLLVATGCFVTRAGATAGADLLAARASASVRATVRAGLLARIANRSHWRLPRTTGELATILTDRVEALDAYITQYQRAAAMCVIGPAMVFVVIGVLDPLCLIVLTFTGPMLVFLLAVIGSRTRKLTEAREAELGWLHAFFLDMVSGLGTLKAFGRADDGAATIERVSRRHGHAAMEVLRTAFQTSLVMEWAATAATALVAVIVSLRLVNDQMPFPVALAVLVITPEFFLPFRRLAVAYHAGSDGKAALGSLAELRIALRAERPARANIDLAIGVAPIHFDGVTTRYPGTDRDALAPATFTVAPGEIVALVGPSGSGKTTITRLLLQLLQPSAGTITVGDRNLSAIEPTSWHRQIAWVSQHPVIVAATIADNVRLGRPDADAADVQAALAAAGATAFIRALPDGVNTMLDEGGRSLSAGQRQRLAIARAFLRDAPFVVLDEFTAHLDDATEEAVLDATRALLVGRTALIVSHRDRAIALADRVVTLAPSPVRA